MTTLTKRAGALLMLAALAAAVGCGSGSGPSSSPSPSAKGKVVLTVVGETTTKKFTMAELKALPAYTGYAGIKTSVGTIYPPVKYTGVSVQTLADQVGGLTAKQSVAVFAKDGYGMTFSFAQAHGRTFTTFDPATGDEEPASGQLTMVIAYAVKGKPLDATNEGPLRLVVAEQTPSQVVDGHWAIKWVDKVEIRRAVSDWSVDVEGAVSTKITRSSYVNCASPGCHGSSYRAADGDRYEGVPLWLVAGLADDQKKHDAGAFNKALAKKGYVIYIFGRDGSVATVNIRDVAGKDSVILTSKVNGGELPEKDFPLMLVGPGLSAKQQIGGIAKIVLKLP